LRKKRRGVDFDRVLIDWADEIIQDLVASFSARRPSMTLRLAVVGFYVFAALHLVFAAILPFYRDAFASVITGGASRATTAQLEALATGIVVGGISYHLLLTVGYVLMSFVVRASKRWTRVAGTVVLGVNFVVALNGLRTPDISDVFPLLQWITLTLASAIIVLMWTASFSESASFSSSPGRTLSGDARE
jgi:hypothetical protein